MMWVMCIFFYLFIFFLQESKAVRQAMVGILAAGAIMVSGVPALL